MIQSCIDATDSGDECVVAPGTYHETINFFGKAMTVRSSHGPDVTVIDGTGIGGSVVTCVSGEANDTVLKGLTIHGGTGTDIGGRRYGGALFGYLSGPSLVDCTFRDNCANLGGAVFTQFGSTSLRQCTFERNTADEGGAVFSYRDTIAINNCLFIGNFANEGGGVFNSSNSPKISDCTFVENNAQLGGGMYNWFATPYLNGNQFIRNRAYIDPYSGAGGAITNLGSNSILIGCEFLSNQAADGGAMYVSGESVVLSACIFRENAADIGGAFYGVSGCKARVTNSVFEGNSATIAGGGLANSASELTMSNCLLVGNRQESTSVIGLGGGVYSFWLSSTVLAGCTLVENSAYGGSSMALKDSDGRLVSCVVSGGLTGQSLRLLESSLTVRNSAVRGGLPLDAVDGGGNLGLDPMFVRIPSTGPDGLWDGVDDDYGDLRLQHGSPCINAGDPSLVSAPSSYGIDLDGHARVLCERVDMGAYEFGIGDFDCDQTVTLADFAQWEDCMTGPNSQSLRACVPPCLRASSQTPPLTPHTSSQCIAFDFDGDGDMDLTDFAGQQLLTTP